MTGMTRDAARARLAELRVRAQTRRDAYTGPWSDPEHDARLSAENAPFMALQAETEAWAPHTCPTACDPDCDAACHEVHAVRWRRTHNVADCEERAHADSAGMPGTTRGSIWESCMGLPHRVLCWADNVNHEHLGSRFRLVCRLHDGALTRVMLR